MHPPAKRVQQNQDMRPWSLPPCEYKKTEKKKTWLLVVFLDVSCATLEFPPCTCVPWDDGKTKKSLRMHLSSKNKKGWGVLRVHKPLQPKTVCGQPKNVCGQPGAALRQPRRRPPPSSAAPPPAPPPAQRPERTARLQSADKKRFSKEHLYSGAPPPPTFFKEKQGMLR
jgi:hypothetical protein